MRWLQQIASFSSLVLVLLSLFVPTSYVAIKSAFMALALILVFILALASKIQWSKATLVAVIVVSTLGLLNSLHGLINFNPGAWRVLTVMAAWPLIYGIFSGLLNQGLSVKYLSKTFMCALVMIIVYSYLFLGNMAGFVPNWAYFELDQGQLIGFHEGFIEYRLFSISSLLFLMPFFLHRFFLQFRAKELRFSSWLILVSGLLLCVLTGRRAVQLIIVLVPAIVLCTNFLATPDFSCLRYRLRIPFKVMVGTGVTLVVLALVVSQMNVKLDILWQQFWDGFQFGEDHSSASERTGQFQALMTAWCDGNYLLGAGNGAVTDYVRSEDMPWAYELTYVYLLFSTGIVGVMLYTGWFAWGMLRVRSALIQRQDMVKQILPMMTGVIGLGIGAASNPYFGKFDYLWIIMLPHLLAGSIWYQQMEN